MTFAVLRSLYDIIGEALDDIERVYHSHGHDAVAGDPDAEPGTDDPEFATKGPAKGSPCSESKDVDRSRKQQQKATLSFTSLNAISKAYVSPPPSPCVATHDEEFQPAFAMESVDKVDFPSLDSPFDPTSLAESLTSHPAVMSAINRIIAACGQMTATVQTPFLTICDSTMGYHLPSCMRLVEAAHVAEILREQGAGSLHVDKISELSGVEPSKLAHTLRLLATHHIFREISPDVFSLNRISSLIDSGKTIEDLIRYRTLGRPELKYSGTNGIAAFVGLCTDEINKSSAYMTETYLLSKSPKVREASQPTLAPFCFAFGTAERGVDFFGWLEGLDVQDGPNPTGHDYPFEADRGAGYPGLGFSDPSRNRITGPVVQGRYGRTQGSRSALELKKQPENPNRFRLERFGKAMSGTGSWEAPGAVFNGFDWRSLAPGSVVVDVGGGIGSTSMLLASAFASSEGEDRGLRFVIQDRSVVAEMGEKAWRENCPELLDSGVAAFQVHDFFTPQPVRNASVFLLRVVLHDWPDDYARKILLHLREAATPETRLLLADFVLPLACADNVTGDSGLEAVEGAQSVLAPAPLLPNLGKASANVYWMDLSMSAMFNSQERTLREIVALTSSAGWKVIKVTQAPGSLFGHIVAIPVDIPAPIRRPRMGSESLSPTTSTSSFFGAADETKIRVGMDEEEKHHAELAEQASVSRCGTPTFGSRMELPSVKEALAKFGGGVKRYKGPGNIGRGLSSTQKPGEGLKAVGTKKPSPLSISPLPRSPSTVPTLSPTPPPRRSPGLDAIKRRGSLVNLKPVPQREPPPALPSIPQPPLRTPLSPTQQRYPVISRRASHATPLPQSPSFIPICASPDPLIPSSHRHTTSITLSTPRPRQMVRRSSSAQLSPPVSASPKLDRATLLNSPISIAGGVHEGSGSGMLHAGSRVERGAKLRFDDLKNEEATSPQRNSPGGSSGGVVAGSVLAAAARIERGLYVQIPPSP